MALAWANERVPMQPAGQVPSLANLVLDHLAAQPDKITDVSCMAEHLAVGLLLRLHQKARLDFRLACIFHQSGHGEIVDAISQLNLFDAMPSHNVNSSCRYR